MSEQKNQEALDKLNLQPIGKGGGSTFNKLHGLLRRFLKKEVAKEQVKDEIRHLLS